MYKLFRVVISLVIAALVAGSGITYGEGRAVERSGSHVHVGKKMESKKKGKSQSAGKYKRKSKHKQKK